MYVLLYTENKKGKYDVHHVRWRRLLELADKRRGQQRGIGRQQQHHSFSIRRERCAPDLHPIESVRSQLADGDHHHYDEEE